MNSDSIILGGGCFWCFEALYMRVQGILSVTSGYAGGTSNNPTYWDLHKPGNDHAEVVKIEYNPAKINLETIFDIFWALHNPTTPNQQGADIGVEYRSIILYNSDAQKQLAEKTLNEVAEPLWDKPIVTEIKQLDVFWPAEEEHQNYFAKHPDQAYCQIVINPKVSKLKKKFAHLLQQ